MEGLPALAGGRADEHNVAFDVACCGLGLHPGNGGADDTEDAVEVGGDGFLPLAIGHGSDRLIVRGPDPVVENGAIDSSESCDHCVDEGLPVCWGEERLLDGVTELRPSAFFDEGLGLCNGGAVAECNLSAGLTERETDGGSSDSTGTPSDEGDFCLRGTTLHQRCCYSAYTRRYRIALSDASYGGTESSLPILN